MEEPQWVPLERLAAARGERPLDLRCSGLWVAGTLEGLRRPCVAVVGTRAATSYGRRIATELARDLAAWGCCVLSGLALGIDAAAHEGALAAGGATAGVLGSGHARFFPRRNRGLAERMIAGGGAVLSPFAPERPAFKSQFLQRNGVVAALADGVVVVEAPSRSGALNTASWAAGKVPVMAFPGDVDRASMAGCLRLLRDGATLVRHAGDVLEALGLAGGSNGAALPLGLEPPEPQDPAARAVLNALPAREPAAVEDLAAACGLPGAALLAALSVLELEGRVERCGPSSYARRSGGLLH